MKFLRKYIRKCLFDEIKMYQLEYIVIYVILIDMCVKYLNMTLNNYFYYSKCVISFILIII